MTSTPSSLRRRRARGRSSRSSRWRCRRSGRPGCARRGPVRSTPSRGSPAAPLRQTWTPLIDDVQIVRLEHRLGGADGGSTRPQLGSLPNSAHLSRLLRAIERPTSTASSSLAAPTTSIRDLLGGALGVGDQLARRGRRRRCAAPRRIRGTSGDAPGRAAGQHDHRVVGGHAAVGVDPVEGDPRPPRAAPRPARCASTAASVVMHAQHRRQARREHAGALGHAADRPAVGRARRPAWPWCRSCGSPRPRRRRRRRQRGDRGVDAGEQLGHRQPLADQPGRADRDVAGTDVERGGDLLGGAVGVGETVRTGARVGAAGVEDDGAQPAVAERPAADHSTGAALTRLVVNTAAAASLGPSLTTSATSRVAGGLEAGRDAGGPEALPAPVTRHGRDPVDRRGRRSRAGRA